MRARPTAVQRLHDWAICRVEAWDKALSEILDISIFLAIVELIHKSWGVEISCNEPAKLGFFQSKLHVFSPVCIPRHLG